MGLMTQETEMPQQDLFALAHEVAAQFIHRLFPSFRAPGYVACPNDEAEHEVIFAITAAAEGRGVETEVVDLRPAPAARLAEVTSRLCGFEGYRQRTKHPQPHLLILIGFDLLEGRDNDEPTYPFRSKFQFDRDFVWLFVGRDWQRLGRLFGSYSLPLYNAASDLTPESWRCPAGNGPSPDD
jgi:hypothetical protein